MARPFRPTSRPQQKQQNAQLEQRIAEVEARVERMSKDLLSRMELEKEVDLRLSDLQKQVAQLEAEEHEQQNKSLSLELWRRGKKAQRPA